MFILYVSLFLFSPALSAAQPKFEERSNPLYFGFSLAIATAMAGVIFILLKKFCRPNHMVQGQDDIEEPGHRASVGLDPYVLETFPVFKYSDVVVAHRRAGIGPLECSVCLSSFEVDDEGKDGGLLVLLPKCNHVFHVGCVDPWFKGHTTCPLCRTDLVPKADELTTTRPESSQVMPELGGWEGVVEVNAGGDDDELEVRGDIEEGQFWKFRRWKSTGDATEVKSEEEDDWKRFTLRLPEEKMMELGEKSGEFRRASSI